LGDYISDFQTADKATVEVLTAPSDGDVVRAVIESAISPGHSPQGDDKLLLPALTSIKSSQVVLDGQQYVYVQFPSTTVTSSGYDVRRRNFGVAAVRGGKLYALVASSRKDYYDAEKEALLAHIVQSFRLR